MGDDAVEVIAEWSYDKERTRRAPSAPSWSEATETTKDVWRGRARELLRSSGDGLDEIVRMIKARRGGQ